MGNDSYSGRGRPEPAGRSDDGVSLLQPGARRPRVLVCEDDPAIRTLVRAVLGREQFDVVTASNGADAIARLRDPFEVIVLDLLMPDKNGYDVLDYLEKTNPALIGRVIVLTARADLVRQPMSGRVAEAMTKPFDVMEFAAAVHRVAGEA